MINTALNRWLLGLLCVAMTGCGGGDGDRVSGPNTPQEDASPMSDAEEAEPDVENVEDVEGEDVEEEEDVADAPDPDPPMGRCDDFAVERQPFFGDLHVHTSYSFDSYGLRNPRSGPEEAYRFAKGQAVSIPPYDEEGSTRPQVQLAVPLDFTAVTDHSEFIGELDLCITEGSAAYDTVACANFRNSTDFEAFIGADVAFAGWGAGLTLGEPSRPAFCNRDGVDCPAAQRGAWTKLQGITEDANQPCEFTAFHGYEYTGSPGGLMNHRNVIFKTNELPEAPITALDANDWQGLAERLMATCNGNDDIDCEALAIPHNPNYSGGIQFAPRSGDGSPLVESAAALRARMEPLVEIIQAKEESECRNGFTGYAGAEDEACEFEKRDHGVPICLPDEVPCENGESPEEDDCLECLRECEEGEVATDSENPCVSPLDYVRNALKEGMVQWANLGVNPYKFGFIGSTDTHNATPGRTEESEYSGHHGFNDDEVGELLIEAPLNGFAVEPGAGGLAVVWAEENTRASIFSALQRKETYATSGTRPIVRFFGGVPEDICERDDFVEVGYAEGQPMGGDLAGVIDGGEMILAVHARQDENSVGLQQVQIVKTWVDADGVPQEQVFDITPDGDDGASVDLTTCETTGPSRAEICAVFKDLDFDPALPTAYYARVLEAPTCRWNTWLCVRENIDCTRPVDQRYSGCCSEDVPKTIQERAWTSPVFYEP